MHQRAIELPFDGAATLALRQPRRFGVFACCIIAGVVFGAAGSMVGQQKASRSALAQMPVYSAPAAAPVSPFEQIEVTIRRNDTMDAIFRRLELSLSDLAALRSVPEIRKSLDRLRPGDVIKLSHLNGELASMVRRVSVTETLSVTRQAEGFDHSIIENPLETRQAAIAGGIASSLFRSVSEAGGSEQLAVDLAEVFRYDIDFVNEVQPGDRFAAVYEQAWQDGEFVQDGGILAAEFVNEGRTYRAVRYVMPDGTTEFYTPDGRSLRKAFLRFPVAFGRVSSGFNMARRHPILNRVRAHKGIDFAAPIGTPVKAAADGRVQLRGVQGGYGNVVILAHSGGVTTLYGHLSRFANGLRNGDRVKQGQLIGYIGMTGLSTGPHLHYEYRVNGVHRDPSRIKHTPAEPIPARLKADFLEKTRPLLARLDGVTSPAGSVSGAR
ncbi:MAG: M23 family metallopeptidase [Gammaproteobacteria bacterium]|nr:M23 family metallopeptidase [Gammaproteobacteria bacterium]